MKPPAETETLSPAYRPTAPLPPEIHHWSGEHEPNRIHARWLKPKADQDNSQPCLLLQQRTAGQHRHRNLSPCFRPEICGQGSWLAITFAVNQLVNKKGWQLTSKPRCTADGNLQYRLTPPQIS